jgi:hypothetical protein
MNFKLEFLSSTKEKINLKLEKIKYLSSPIIYRILYDKYNRPEIFSKIRTNKISEVKYEKVMKIEMTNKFINIPDNQNIANQSKIAFQENLIYSYYNTIFNERVFLLNLVAINLSQVAIYKLLTNLNFDKKSFIFLDNNRAIFNKILSVCKGLTNFLKFNVGLTTIMLVYFSGNYLVKEYYRPSQEEKLLIDEYKRSNMLYRKIFNY